MNGNHINGSVSVDSKDYPLLYVGERIHRIQFDVYTSEGKGYLLQGDAVGNLHLLDAMSGEILSQLSLGANIESSPAVYENTLLVSTRGGEIMGIELN